MNRRDPINNRDIALNWKGLPLPVSLKLAVCLTELLNTHKPTWQQARAVTMNFRDPSYGPESGGFHPVEIRAYSHAWRSLNNIHADHVITSMPITQ
ncbi:DUF2787 family protein, partial [Aeromonas caviae]